MITQLQQQQKREQKQRDWFQQLLDQEENVAEHDPGWMQCIRSDASQRIREASLLSRKQEAWRYSRVEDLFDKNFNLVSSQSNQKQTFDIDAYRVDGLDSYRVVFVNGYYAAEMSDTSGIPSGVTLNNLRSEFASGSSSLKEWLGSHLQHNDHVFSALNNALLGDGLLIHIDTSTRLDKPVEIIYLDTHAPLSGSEGSLLQTRNIIILDKGASASLVERYIGAHHEKDNQHYFHNHVSDIVLRDESILEHVRFQDEHSDAWHMASVYVTQGMHSRYQGCHLAFGGGWARTSCRIDLDSPQADCDLTGLYAVGDEQLVDFHLDIQHKVPECRSREQFRGILHGRGRAVFDGHILVASQAQHSDAALTNDNLLLTSDAEVDTKPQLEIYADDVKCSHGTTVGRLDRLQMYYLQSRGIAEADARRLLCQGFADDILKRISNDVLKTDVAAKLMRRLNQSMITAGE